MKNKKLILCLILLVVVITCTATACFSTDDGEKGTFYYATNDDGSINQDVWYAVGNGTWVNENGEIGSYVQDGKAVVFYTVDGTVFASGTVDGGILSVNVDGKANFFYSEGYSFDAIIGINAVYAKAQELGFNGTLDDLIEAFKGDSAYQIACNNGYQGTEVEWLATLIGETGAQGNDGQDGTDGVSPTIIDGYWYVGDINTGVKAQGEKGDKGDDGQDGAGITNIEKLYSQNGVDTYVITYGDGQTFNFTVTNGKDAEYDLSVDELFVFAINNGYSGSYTDFIKLFDSSVKDVTHFSDALLSSVTVQGETGTGSGVIYSIDKEKGDAIIVTNYHVIYDDYATAYEPKYSENIKVYLYGSEVSANDTTDAEEMGIEAEFIGGTMQYDIAVLRIRESDLIKNSIAKAVSVADSDKLYVGQDVIAVGNAEGEGISATQGIISVPSENIVILSVDGASYVSRRVVRMDAPVSPGNSGGGLFDTDGNLVGIVSAKRTESADEGIGYAIPSNVMLTVTVNILQQYASNPTEKHTLYRPLVGMTIYVKSSQAVMGDDGIPYIKERVCVDGTTAGSLCDGKFLEGDVITAITVGDRERKEVIHVYTLTDEVMAGKVGDEITFEVERNGENLTITVTVTEQNMNYAQ